MSGEHSSSSDAPRETPAATSSKWWDVTTAAAYLGIGRRSVYAAANKGDLRVVRLFARGEIRTTAEWCDAFMIARATPEPAVPMVSGRRRAS